MTIRRRHSVNPLTFGTLAHKRGQGKAGAASLAIGGQSAIGNELIPNAAAMGIINKLNKFAADRKRTAAASAASASSHNYSSKLLEAISKNGFWFNPPEADKNRGGREV